MKRLSEKLLKEEQRNWFKFKEKNLNINSSTQEYIETIRNFNAPRRYNSRTLTAITKYGPGFIRKALSGDF